MTINKEVYILRERYTVKAITSNLLTIYRCMQSLIPSELRHRLKSYHQINRILKRTNSVEFPLPDHDWYYIEKQRVYSSYGEYREGSAGEQPSRLRPNDRCGTLAQRG